MHVVQKPLKLNILPSSSKFFLDIHILLNAFKDETVAPPTQQEYCLLLGAISVGFTSFALFCSCLCSLSQNYDIKVVLPATTISLYSAFLKSISHFWIQFATISCTPGYSNPINSGLNSISGALDLSLPSLIV